MKKSLQGALKSKTMWFSILIAIGGTLQANVYFLQTLLSAKASGYLMLIIGIIVAILRVVTFQSLTDKAIDHDHSI